MDGLVEEEDSPYVESIVVEKASSSWTMINPFTYSLEFLATYGWFLLAAGLVAAYCWRWFATQIELYKQKRWDAEYHKDPDKALERMEAIQRARERQQQKLEAASQRAQEEQKEREERKRAEALERLKKYGTASGGRVLGSPDDDYMPLSAGGSTSSYRPQKRSKCSGGGCGR